jgi:hypothetical protein
MHKQSRQLADVKIHIILNIPNFTSQFIPSLFLRLASPAPTKCELNVCVIYNVYEQNIRHFAAQFRSRLALQCRTSVFNKLISVPVRNA